MSNSKLYTFENQFTLENCVGRVVIAVIAHPFDLAKILIQLGYEPLPPYPTKTLFGRQRLALPGVFQYLGHIRRMDGFFGIYRGIGYKLSSVLIKWIRLRKCQRIDKTSLSRREDNYSRTDG